MQKGKFQIISTTPFFVRQSFAEESDDERKLINRHHVHRMFPRSNPFIFLWSFYRKEERRRIVDWIGFIVCFHSNLSSNQVTKQNFKGTIRQSCVLHGFEFSFKDVFGSLIVDLKVDQVQTGVGIIFFYPPSQI